jgi:hypothetical protein
MNFKCGLLKPWETECTIQMGMMKSLCLIKHYNQRCMGQHCISLLVYEVKSPSQALCWPLGLIGCPPSLFPGLQTLETYCPRSFLFYKLGQDSDTRVHCPLYCVHTVGILAILCVQVCTDEPSCLCGLLTALQQPWVSIYS